MPAEAPATVAPGHRPEAPTRHNSVANAAASPPPVRAQPSAQKTTLDKLRLVGQGMKDGTIQDRREANAAVADHPQSPTPNTPNAPRTPSPGTTAKPSVATPADQQTPEQKAALADSAKKLSAAKRVLARDGWMPTDFDKYEADDLIDRADQRKQVHAETDRTFGEYAKLKNQVPQPRAADGKFEAKTPEQQAAADAQAAHAPKAADPTPDGDISALMAEVEAKAGKDTAGLFGKLATLLSQKFGERTATGENLARAVLIQDGQRLFAELYPTQATDDPAAFEDVQLNFGVLLDSGRYQPTQLRKAWTDALYMAFGPSSPQELAQREMLARQSSAQRGRVDPGAHAQAPAAAQEPSKRDQLKAAGELMKANPKASLEELRRMLPGR